MSAVTVQPYSRKVSFNERLYMGGTNSKGDGLYIQYVFEGEGQLALEQLRDAVRLAADANPGVRLVRRGILKWMRWVAEGPIPSVTLLDNWAADAEPPAEIHQVMNLTEGPSCQVFLCQSPRLRLVFRCFHGVMDGGGLFHFIQEVFRALRGEPCKGAPSTLNDSEFVKSLVGDVKRPAVKLSWKAPLERSSSRGTRIHWQRFILEGSHAGFLTKVATILAQCTPAQNGSSIRILIPVDIRSYKREIKSSGNMSYPILIDVNRQDTWQNLQKVILKKLVSKEPLKLDPLEDLVAWVPLWIMRLTAKGMELVQRYTGKYFYSVLLSHTTIANRAEYCGGGFELKSVRYVPGQTAFAPLAIASVGVGDRLDAVVFGLQHTIDETQLAAVIAAIRAGL